MGFAGHYLARHVVTSKIDHPPAKNFWQTIVIPCLDEPALTGSLESLWLCDRPSCAVEVIIVINSPEDAPDDILESNLDTLKKAERWARDHNEPGFTFHVLYEPSLPAKYAGPGLARKTGMDQAILRFNLLDRPGGVIVSFDADTTCKTDYLVEIERTFTETPGLTGCNIYFEHPVQGKQFPGQVYRAITEYELHLRYYIEAIRHTGFPYAYHTIGSAFCVTAAAYVSQGGMNRRKAGEDFYFLQKIIPVGRFTEINSTCVYPSPRPSGRVPFGTGAVIKKYVEGRIKAIDTYHPDAFGGLKKLFAQPSEWFGLDNSEVEKKFSSLPETVRDFTGKEFILKIGEIKSNCATPESFTRRFWQWFNMFRILKYLNFVHTKYYARVPVREAAKIFLEGEGYGAFGDRDEKGLLGIFRKIQREGKYEIRNSESRESRPA
ncbi:MAG: hypothetical protein AMS27_18230 [Bacteroides sp. SM23_62_1]|nr:MAG: hypothetical protein AMS27_18230 [Bacteroides sp. SM23_62_1]